MRVGSYAVEMYHNGQMINRKLFDKRAVLILDQNHPGEIVEENTTCR